MKWIVVTFSILVIISTQQMSLAQTCSLGQQSGDLNEDGFVNLLDYVILAASWLDRDCGNSNGCNCADFDFSGNVDMSEVGIPPHSKS